ncbi:M14 family zinc carboxypeptidase [Glycomyces buryatensis]|uniref:Zinc carboxypeptidase n=1 Tax=Glycomyces buryatensis TaxID=2570927 RepID=A0A4S8PQZ5_9ACTN|nr:M14 family zinc carboxypeptidase [Glycomyces buryatensis]THV33620.1 peptidase M14 [Glycomyces buryatensis]
MHSKRRLVTAGIAIALTAVATGVATMTAQADPAGPAESEPVTWSLSGLTADQVADLEGQGFDVAEAHEDSTLVIGDDAIAEDLRGLGYDPQFHDTVYKEIAPGVRQEGTYYGGYHTVEQYEAHLDEVAAANPDLTQVFDIGDSWLKTQGEGGHDIMAICITKIAEGDCEQSPESTKPRFSMISQIHAREIATGEISWRWIDKLVEGYGTDDAVTELLDTTEVWVVPIGNPDGVDIVASGGDDPILQRKNANDSNGDCGESLGVDLNRNSSFEWGADSTNPCAETFQGPAAASEPETQAIEDWLRAIHPDQRGESATDPAPDDARDVFISLHSYGEYIIVPWGYTDDSPPNDDGLRALGNAMSDSNGYLVGTGSETVGYATSGTTDDFTYGELGIASYTYEVGPDSGNCGGFFPAYECVDDSLWPANEDALMTAAQAAAAPYAE